MTGAAFTDPTAELGELVRRLASAQNVVLSAPRRYGKTSLALMATERLRAAGVLVAYVDLYRVVDKAQLVGNLLTAFYAQMATGPERARRSLRDRIQSLVENSTVAVSAGVVTWRYQPPAVDSQALADRALVAALGIPATLAIEHGVRAVVMLDEFQEVTEIDPRLPAVMRSAIQEHREVGYLFAGSRQHLMRRIFTEPGQAMFRVGRQMALPRLQKADLEAFVGERFRTTDKEISTEAVSLIVEIGAGIPQATQELAQEAWDLAGEPAGADAATVRHALDRVVGHEQGRFIAVWDELSSPQRRVLRAIALGGWRCSVQ